mmetsp:Transcript_7821/g.13108  ORF Transcript_7821/g.13108 Transcript_7821/m.13108 type:complete len:229 (+) Transcript_7821:2377-3063(+)
MEDLVPDLLAVARPLTDEAKDGPEDVGGGEELLLRVLGRQAESLLVLLAHLLDEALLGVLQLLGLGVEASLPGQLPREAESEPDVEVGHVVSTRDLEQPALEEVPRLEVPVHQRPHVVVDLAVEDLLHQAADLAQREIVELARARDCDGLRAEHDYLVLALDGVPDVLVLLGEHVVDRVDRIVHVLHPLDHDLHRLDALVLLRLLELGLAGQAVGPLDGASGPEGLVG